MDIQRAVHPLHICTVRIWHRILCQWFNLKDLISALDYKTFDLNVRKGSYGQTFLMYACNRGNMEATIRLLELGANANIPSGKGRMALFDDVLRVKDDTSLEELENSVAIINTLLELASSGNEVDVNMPNLKLSNRTAVMMAIYQKLPELALLILRHLKIEINQQDSGGYAALYLAVFVGLADIVKEMLEFDGIIVDVVEFSASRTALMFAAERNRQKIVELLLCRGAKPNLQNSSGATAMLGAVEEGSTDVVRVMFNPQREVNLFTLYEDNRTLLRGTAENEYTEILDILHEKGL
jgi:ankyrin repeat protein